MNVEKTTNYGIFKLRPDNRERICERHLVNLENSIKAKNLLEYRPILVNKQMEVMDGQHRLMVAKNLGVPIYYTINAEIKTEDMIALNTSKNWVTADILNFYCKNGNSEYIKLKKLMDEKKITVTVALACIQGDTRKNTRDFRTGKFLFNFEGQGEEFDIVWKSIEIVCRYNGHKNTTFTKSAKFWKPLLYMIKQDNFKEEKWIHNLEKMVKRIISYVSSDDFYKCFLEIYNWRNIDPIRSVDQRINF